MRIIISTHTPLTGRDIMVGAFVNLCYISTHTPLTGRDEFFVTLTFDRSNFYSHAPYGT